MIESNSFFRKQFDILSEEPSQCRAVPAYIAPGGVGRTPNQKRDTPHTQRRSSTFHSFESPQEPKMLRALNVFGVDRFARYNRFPPRRHVQKLFIFEIEFRFTFLSQKSRKVDLKVPFSNSKNSMIFNDLLAVASEHKFEKNFFLHYNF